ncbi:MAG: glycosyltransferase family 39 protein [Gammaproteobacteria bacterium]
MWSIFQGQDIFFDTLNYHFYNGYAFLNHRMGWDIAPAREQTYLNPFLDVLNYLLISTQKPLIVAFIQGAVSGLNCYLLYKIAEILFSIHSTSQKLLYIFFAVLIGTTSASGITVLGSATNDTKMSLLLLIGLYFLIRHLTSTDKSTQTICLILAGFATGFAAALKYVAISNAIGITLALLLSQRWNRKHVISCGLFVIYLTAGYLLVNGYWMYFLYQHFQSPIFPFYNTLFHSPYYTDINLNGIIKHDHLMYPLFFIMGKGGDPRFAILILLACIILLKHLFQKQFLLRKSSELKVSNAALQTCWRSIGLYFVFSYLLWNLFFTDFRYLLPLELISGLLVVLFVQHLIKQTRIQLILLMLLTTGLLFFTSILNLPRALIDNKYFNVTPPVLPPHSIVIFNSEPLSYTIPFFQKDVRFIGMPFLIKMEYDAKNDFVKLFKSKFRSKFVDPLIQNTKEHSIYILTNKFYPRINLQLINTPFIGSYFLSYKDSAWHLYNIANEGSIVEIPINEVDGLKSFLDKTSSYKSNRQLTNEEKKQFDKLILAYNLRYHFKNGDDMFARDLAYRYGLIADDKKCISIYSNVIDNLMLCPVKKLNNQLLSKNKQKNPFL